MYRMIGAGDGAMLQRQTEGARGIVAVHRGPAVGAVADIGRGALLPRKADQDRDETVITLAVVGGRQPHGRRVHAAGSEGVCGGFGRERY